MSVRRAALLLLLICLTNAEPPETWKSYPITINENLEGATLIDPREESPSLVFGYCHDKKCTFYRESETIENRFDPATYLRSCRFQFDLGEVIELYPFGSDKIIFMYNVFENKRFGILSLSSCRVNIANINADLTMMYARVMVTDENRFEIAVNNFGEGTMCQERECKMTFGKGGDDRSQLNEWIEAADYRTVASSNERGGYIVVDGDVETKSVVVYTVDEKGKEFIMTNYTSHLIPPVSTAHQFVTTCGSKDSHLQCVQFDRDGNERFAATVAYRNIAQAKLHNLPGGGFVLLTSRCPRTISHCKDSVSHFQVTKADATGRLEGSFKITEFGDDLVFDLNRVYFFLKDNGAELCFSNVLKRHLRKGEEQVVEIFCRSNEFTN